MSAPDRHGADLFGASTRDPERLKRRRALTVELRRLGWSWRRIADYMGVSVSTARDRATKGANDGN